MPSGLGDGNYFYHRYVISRDLQGADPECVFRKLVEQPTPGRPSPATPGGTVNDATVTGLEFNPVTSYLTQGLRTGIPLVVNMAGVGGGTYIGTGSGPLWGPGYVARYVLDGRAYTVGEGTNWKQSPNLTGDWFQDFGNKGVWGLDLERKIKDCKCER